MMREAAERPAAAAATDLDLQRIDTAGLPTAERTSSSQERRPADAGVMARYRSARHASPLQSPGIRRSRLGMHTGKHRKQLRVPRPVQVTLLAESEDGPHAAQSTLPRPGRQSRKNRHTDLLW